MKECYSVMAEDSYLITDSIAYAQLPSSTYDSIQADLGCSDNPSRPPIDFDQYYLVGAKTLAKGCIVTYSRDINYLSSSNSLQYKIDVHQCGDCGDKRYNMNWVLIQNTETINPIDSLIVHINYYIESN
ncbi:MAG: hypothetical protein C0599_07925 [Salinivirgaceae bacterium]|nr:MAG: hypothetical protein C0599_07925 [Salinivirgaceae bacterium]